MFASKARRREIWLGGRNVLIIIGNMLFPGVGDRYLAATGYGSQLSDEPATPNRPDNLYRPIPGYGAHGRFDARAKTHSPELWLSRHRGWVASVGLAAIGLALAARRLGGNPRGVR